MSATQVCPSCQKPTPADQAFCIHCGQLVKPLASPGSQTSGRGGWPLLAGGLLVLLAIGAFALWRAGLISISVNRGQATLPVAPSATLQTPEANAGMGGGPDGTPTATASPPPTLLTTPLPSKTPPPTATLSPTPPPLPSPTTEPTPATRGDVIFFSRSLADSDGDGTADWEGKRVICRIDTDGTNEGCLTDDTYSSALPNWSPDGRTIVFASDRDLADIPEIYLMDPDGSNWRRLTNNRVNDHGPSWSPDGAWIVFHREGAGGTAQLYRMRPDGSDQTPIVPNGRDNRYPVWSATGRIAYESRADDGYHIYLTDPDGRSDERITPGGMNQSPAWSPDGRYLAFSQGDPQSGQGFHIMIYDTQTGQTRQATTGNNAAEPAWSPDGGRIAFAYWVRGVAQIWLLDVGSGNMSQLVFSDGYLDTQPAWAP